MEKREKAAAGHFLRFWLGGGAMLLVALWLAQALPDYTPMGMFLLSACIIFWLGLWIAAFAGGARRLQDKLTGLPRQLEETDLKIAFCHQVLEEAKRVRVRKTAEALVAKEAASKRKPPPKKAAG